jgi:uncharacterized protein YcaQ
VDEVTARRFHRRATLLEVPALDVQTALEHHGYVQIDPINVCGRMHDLILRNRVAGYAEGDLIRHIHQPSRPGFEHYLPGQRILCVFPLSAWPYLLPEMEHRRGRHGGYGGKLSKHEEELASHILDEITERGPLMSDQITHEGRAMTAWGTTGREVKIVLEKLFFHGRVLITARRNFRRVYDLPERVLPPSTLAKKAATAEAQRRWLLLTRLRQRRLATLTKADLPLVEDAVQPIRIGNGPVLHCLREDAPLLAGANPSEYPGEPLLLAPLDPLIYDRRVTRSLWDFDYTWEVYTPPHKRVRGYYALPVLHGHQIVGHVDLAADRKARKLLTVGRQIRRGSTSAAAVQALARFLGLRR